MDSGAPTVRDAIQKLAGAGFKVCEFSNYHYRVEGRLDIFPNNRNGYWAWHDREYELRSANSESRYFRRDHLLADVKKHFLAHPHLAPVNPNVLAETATPPSDESPLETRLRQMYDAGASFREMWTVIKPLLRPGS